MEGQQQMFNQTEDQFKATFLSSSYFTCPRIVTDWITLI